MMNQKVFYIILSVVVITIILGFIISFVLEIRRDENKTKDIKYPPMKNKCPDYWEVQDDNVCRNTHAIGLCKTGGDRDMNFNDELFTSRKGEHYKCAWAKQCDVPWEGIDNIC
tara:strand:- start:25 stop:363 length:339 start_codon:yes stop_codon:yes gene_type:complete